ncbi:hypothetical protein KEH51_02295 [[Brevibacterium] frigoritolerans]|uniref:Uncharacterized protein n=1 Tax=Peribacillus frigoritolerans TaxID=450367 RepID=A0A941FHB7_9BACI|nr:hypothetical protein [Peribacillus frigoritolerans]
MSPLMLRNEEAYWNECYIYIALDFSKEVKMKGLLGICISMQMTFVLLFITGITPKLNSYVGATIYLIIGFASLVISLYLAGKKFSWAFRLLHSSFPCLSFVSPFSFISCLKPGCRRKIPLFE